jgi:hypothetical protein
VGVAGILPALLAGVARFVRGLPTAVMGGGLGLMFALLTVYSWKVRSEERGEIPLPNPLP